MNHIIMPKLLVHIQLTGAAIERVRSEEPDPSGSLEHFKQCLIVIHSSLHHSNRQRFLDPKDGQLANEWHSRRGEAATKSAWL